jgi:putative addiction module component (TIGR02574 family)
MQPKVLPRISLRTERKPHDIQSDLQKGLKNIIAISAHIAILSTCPRTNCERCLRSKFELMEALWQDLREHFDRMDLSEGQKALLDRRRAAVETGASRLHDWDAVKASSGRS